MIFFKKRSQKKKKKSVPKVRPQIRTLNCPHTYTHWTVPILLTVDSQNSLELPLRDISLIHFFLVVGAAVFCSTGLDFQKADHTLFFEKHRGLLNWIHKPQPAHSTCGLTCSLYYVWDLVGWLKVAEPIICRWASLTKENSLHLAWMQTLATFRHQMGILTGRFRMWKQLDRLFSIRPHMPAAVGEASPATPVCAMYTFFSGRVCQWLATPREKSLTSGTQLWT